MTRLGLSSRDRRTLVVGASVIGALLTIARGLPAIRQWEHTQRSDAESTVEQLALIRGGLKLLPMLRDSLRARTARLSALDSVLLAGNSPADAAAQLAATLEDAAGEDGIKISALQIRPDTIVIRSLSRVAVRITGTTDVTGLASFLRDVESGDRALVVRELSVSQPEPVAPDGKPEALRVEILVEGIALIGGVRRA